MHIINNSAFVCVPSLFRIVFIDSYVKLHVDVNVSGYDFTALSLPFDDKFATLVLSCFMWGNWLSLLQTKKLPVGHMMLTLQGLRWKSLLTLSEISNKISPLKILCRVLRDVVYRLVPEKLFLSDLDYFTTILLDFYRTIYELSRSTVNSRFTE